MANAPGLVVGNPFHHEFRVCPCNGGGYTITAYPYKLRGPEEPTTWAFSTVSDVMAFLAKASGAVVNPMQPSFDFREHLKGEPAHGSAS